MLYGDKEQAVLKITVPRLPLEPSELPEFANGPVKEEKEKHIILHFN